MALSLALATAALSMLQAGLIASLIVYIFNSRATTPLASTLLIDLSIIFTLRATLVYVGEQVVSRAGSRIRAQLRISLVDRVLDDAQIVNRLGSAQISMLTTRGINALEAYFARFLPQLLIAITVPTIIGAYIFYLDTTSGLIVIGTVPLIPILGALIGSYTGAATEKKWRSLGILSGYFLDLVSGITTLKVFGRSKKQEANLETVGEDYRRNTMEVLRVSFLSSLALEIIASLSVALMAVSIGLRLVSDSLDLRTGLLILILAPEVYWPLRMVGTHFHAAADGIEAAKQIFEVLEATPTPNGTMVIGNIDEITIDSCTVRVGDRGTSVQIPQLTLQTGKIFVVTGPSGAGKSTLISLLLGFISHDIKGYRINGFPFEQIELDSYRSHIAWVPQHPRFNRGTIRDLISMGRADASDDEICTALSTVGLPVTTFPNGLETVIGEGASDISVGQARRVALARALIRRSDLLLLDEPSASLDELSESEIIAAVLAEARRGAMVLVVSHHAHVIGIADEVVKIEARYVEA